MSNKDSTQSLRDGIIRHVSEEVPFNTALGLRVCDSGDGWALAALDYQEHFLGDMEQRLWHTSVATAAMDAIFGLALLLAIDKPEPVATLDLRMDYLRPALADHALHIHAECYHLTRTVAFLRGDVFQEVEGVRRMTGHGTSSFMRTSSKR